jgi:hypothetical protein
MRVGYFVYNGKRYESGTKFLFGSKQIGTFLWRDDESGYISYIYTPMPSCYNMLPAPNIAIRKSNDFWKVFKGVTGEIDNSIKPPVIKQKSDSQIDGLAAGWLWYIFLMVASVIFNDVIGLWILWSFIFFTWRSDKIKKEGFYYERQV